MEREPIVVLAGGVGAARFLRGLCAALPERDLTIVGNVGDDTEVAGLHVSPDLDTVLYTLTGEIDDGRGWGVRGDTSRALERARSLGHDAWFWLGDLDIGLHITRTAWLHDGVPLSVVTSRLCGALGLADTLVPATDSRLRTVVATRDGDLDFQDYYVRHGHRPEVTGIRFDGASSSVPAPGVAAALEGAAAIIIAPSNPLVSIAPILAVPGIEAAVRSRRVRCVAVSPIVGGAALRGPAAAMLRSLGHDVSPLALTTLYEGLVDGIVVDDVDAAVLPALRARDVDARATDTVMRDLDTARSLALTALDVAGVGVT